MFSTRARRFCGWALPAVVALASCRQGDDIVAIQSGPETGVPPGEDAGLPLPDVTVPRDTPAPPADGEVLRPDAPIEDVGIPPPIDAPSPPSCEANGPGLTIRRLSGETYDACAGQLAARTFLHALCTCEDLYIPGVATLATDSIDSSNPAKIVLSSGSAVGVTGIYPSARSIIGGTLTVTGTTRPMHWNAGVDIQGDFRLAGRVNVWASLAVKRDVWLMSTLGYWSESIVIEGNLNLLPPTGTFIGIGTPVVRGSRNMPSFTIDDPCGCGAESLDVAEIARVGAEPNDNAMIPIDRTALTNITAPREVTLPCGRFRFDSIGGTALKFTINGRTAIFVDRDVALADLQLAVGPSPDAELDLFIRGNLSVGNARFGNMNRPAATRIYVGGSNDITPANSEIGANIYAPNANVSLMSLAVSIGLAGSIYAKNLSIPGGLIRYDRAILKAGDKCGQPTTCDKSHHACNISAVCNQGVCDRCKVDQDCTVPLACVQGSCQPLLFQ